MAPRHVPVPCSPQGKDKEETISTFYIQLQLIVILVSISEYHLWIIRVVNLHQSAQGSLETRGKLSYIIPEWESDSDAAGSGKERSMPFQEDAPFSTASPLQSHSFKWRVQSSDLCVQCLVFCLGFWGVGGISAHPSPHRSHFSI